MLKHLNLDEMVALIAPWVKKTKRRATFLSIPEIAPFHPKIVQAYQAVLAVRPSNKVTPPALAALTNEAARTDVRDRSTPPRVYRTARSGSSGRRQRWSTCHSAARAGPARACGLPS